MTLRAPVTIVDVDLGCPLPHLDAAGGAVAVFWLDGVPLGRAWVDASELPMTPAHVAVLAADAVSQAVTHRLAHGGRPCRVDEGGVELAPSVDEPLAAVRPMLRPPAGGPEATATSVVVATRDRPAALERCLGALARCRPAPAEIVVVDNSADGTAKEVTERFPSVVYVPAARGGLAAARNEGIRAAVGEVVAFTDDDVEVPPAWVERIAAPFADPAVLSVTGLVLPALLDTEAQLVFERSFGYLHKGFRPFVYDPAFLAGADREAPPVWEIGAGASMAIRRSTFAHVGLFDERLGPGASGVGEDSEMWYRLLAAGGTCVYDPAAVVFHHHRPDADGLEIQMRAYMRGHVSALAVQHRRYAHTGNLRRMLLRLPAWYVRTAPRELLASPLRRRLYAARVRGCLEGLAMVPRLLRDDGAWAVSPPEAAGRPST